MLLSNVKSESVFDNLHQFKFEMLFEFFFENFRMNFNGKDNNKTELLEYFIGIGLQIR